MDPLTHTFLGAALADTGLKRKSALATATLVVGANLPDVDVFSYFYGSDAALGFRRGWTHGVLALVVLPFVLTLLVLAFDRLRRRWREGPPVPLGGVRGENTVRPRQILLLSTLAIVSHPILDWLNTYGMRFLMPFNGRWFYGDALYIVDPWVWLVLGGAVFLVHSESTRALVNWTALAVVMTFFVFSGSGPYTWGRWLWTAGIVLLVVLRRRGTGMLDDGERLARGALSVAAFYAVAMLGLTALARHEVGTELEHRGIETAAGTFLASPDRVDPFVRLVVVPTREEVRFGVYHLLDRPRFRWTDLVRPVKPAAEEVPDAAVDDTTVDDIVAAARAAPCVSGMANWMRIPFYEIDTHNDGYDVYILDARYVRGRTPGFGAAAVVLGRDLVPHCERL